MIFWPPARAALAALALTAVIFVTPVRADTYVMDKEHTNVTFSWIHLGISRQSGRLLDVAGTLDFSPEEPEKSSIDVTMKVQSIWTGVPVLDKQLKSSDYFDAVQFPAMSFKSTGIKKTGDRTGEVVGDLTIMGHARSATLAVTWNYTGEHPLAAINPAFQGQTISGFTATTKLLRSDWGIKRGTPLTSDEIEITINTELIRK